VSLRLVRPEESSPPAARPSIEAVVYRDGRCYASVRWLKLRQMHATEQQRKASGPLNVDAVGKGFEGWSTQDLQGEHQTRKTDSAAPHMAFGANHMLSRP